VAVCKFRFSFLQMATVFEQDFTEIPGCRRAQDWSGKSSFDEQGQVARMIEVGMGKYDGVDTAGINREWSPVAQSQLLVALEQPAIYEYLLPACLKQILRAGDRAYAAKKLK
jgi:hypothetical protein